MANNENTKFAKVSAYVPKDWEDIDNLAIRRFGKIVIKKHKVNDVCYGESTASPTDFTRAVVRSISDGGATGEIVSITHDSLGNVSLRYCVGSPRATEYQSRRVDSEGKKGDLVFGANREQIIGEVFGMTKYTAFTITPYDEIEVHFMRYGTTSQFVKVTFDELKTIIF